MATSREREELKRQSRREEFDRLVEQGTVTVRQMTDEERAKYAPLTPEERERRRRPRRYST